MTNFNNEAYHALVSDLVNDAFYLDGASRRRTIATIRQYAEVVVRKILDLPLDATVELGNGKLQYKIKEKNKAFPSHLGIPMTQLLLRTQRQKAIPSMYGAQRPNSIRRWRTVGTKPSFGWQMMGQPYGCVHLCRMLRCSKSLTM